MRTRVGYAGGTTDKPTYRRIGDHTEAVQIEFDPKRITYQDLLKVFWSDHDPYRGTWSTQYKAVLWTHGEEQAKIARAFVAAEAKSSEREPKTPIVEAPRFWIAEDYHQKYYLRRRGALVTALLGEGWSDEKLRESTATARANGWIAGHGTKAEIATEAEALGLNEEALEELGRALGDRAPALCH